MSDVSCPRCDCSFLYRRETSFLMSEFPKCLNCDLQVTGKQKPEDFYASVDLRKIVIVASAALAVIYHIFDYFLAAYFPLSFVATLLSAKFIYNKLESAFPDVVGPIRLKMIHKLAKPTLLRLFYDPQVPAHINTKS